MNDKNFRIYIISICIISIITIWVLYLVVRKRDISTDPIDKQITQSENAKNANIPNTSPISTTNNKNNENSKNSNYNTANVYKFSVINLCDDKLYCSYDATILGSVNRSICKELPQDMYNLGHIYSFVYYNGCIYYLTGALGLYSSPCSIYKYDIEKMNSTCIANNAENKSACYIANGILFYETAEFDENDIDRQHGVGKINLLTGEYNQIYKNDTDVQIKYCNGSRLYLQIDKYSEQEYFCIDSDGHYISTLTNDEIEIVDGYISGNYTYNLYDGTIYQHQLNEEAIQFFYIPDVIDQYAIHQGSGHIENIIDNRIYYSVLTDPNSKEYNTANKLLIRCDTNGHNEEIAATCFQP